MPSMPSAIPLHTRTIVPATSHSASRASSSSNEHVAMDTTAPSKSAMCCPVCNSEQYVAPTTALWPHGAPHTLFVANRTRRWHTHSSRTRRWHTHSSLQHCTPHGAGSQAPQRAGDAGAPRASRAAPSSRSQPCGATARTLGLEASRLPPTTTGTKRLPSPQARSPAGVVCAIAVAPSASPAPARTAGGRAPASDEGLPGVAAVARGTGAALFTAVVARVCVTPPGRVPSPPPAASVACRPSAIRGAIAPPLPPTPLSADTAATDTATVTSASGRIAATAPLSSAPAAGGRAAAAARPSSAAGTHTTAAAPLSSADGAREPESVAGTTSGARVVSSCTDAVGTSPSRAASSHSARATPDPMSSRPPAKGGSRSALPAAGVAFRADAADRLARRIARAIGEYAPMLNTSIAATTAASGRGRRSRPSDRSADAPPDLPTPPPPPCPPPLSLLPSTPLTAPRPPSSSPPSPPRGALSAPSPPRGALSALSRAAAAAGLPPEPALARRPAPKPGARPCERAYLDRLNGASDIGRRGGPTNASRRTRPCNPQQHAVGAHYQNL